MQQIHVHVAASLLIPEYVHVCTICVHMHVYRYDDYLFLSVCVPVYSHVEMSGSDKENGVDDESVPAEDEFSRVQVEDTSSYLEQLDSEVSHLVCHPYPHT